MYIHFLQERERICKRGKKYNECSYKGKKKVTIDKKEGKENQKPNNTLHNIYTQTNKNISESEKEKK